MRYYLPLLLLCLAGTAWSASPPADFEQQFDPVLSPSHALVAEFYVKEPDSPRQLWIRSTRDPHDGTLLYEYVRNAAVLFSPDERWLVVNDGAGSNVADVHLFRRVRGTKFAEVQGARVTEQAWHLLLQRHRLREVPDHSYAEAVDTAFWASVTGSASPG